MLNPSERERQLDVDQSGKVSEMGCGTSKVDPQVKEAAFRNDKIERQLWQDKRTELKTVRILLLGEHLYTLGLAVCLLNRTSRCW